MFMKTIDYSILVGRAMRSVVRESLKFFSFNSDSQCNLVITFCSNVADVVIPEYLKEKFPNQITIVLQHKFRDLIVTDSDFRVTLSFSGKEESIIVPFLALISFSDRYNDFAVEFSDQEKKDEVVQSIDQNNSMEEDKDDCQDDEDKVINISDFLSKK